MTNETYQAIMKALGDMNRMRIIEILACGPCCACDILDHFDFTQPTLSHHIKVLNRTGLVKVSKKGKWHYYAIDETVSIAFQKKTQELFAHDPSCICFTRSTERTNDSKACGS